MKKSEIILKNFKTELIILSTSVILFIIILIRSSSKEFLTFLNTLCEIVFCNDRLNMIATILTITTGFYLTIATVVSVSVINVSKNILKSQSDRAIITMIMLGIIENIVCIILCTCKIENENALLSFGLSVVLLLSLVTFGKFINFVRHLLTENMKQMQIDIKAAEDREEDILLALRNIEKNTRVK